MSEIKSITGFMERELNRLENKGFEIKRVRFGQWSTFHIKKASDVSFMSKLISVDVVIRPNWNKDNILMSFTTLNSEKKFNYGYCDVAKFKKGFERNILRRCGNANRNN